MPPRPPPFDSCPEPDLAVVPGSPRDYTTFPTSALLVVEVAVSSLAYDLGPKALHYALGNIPEYWVLDVPGRKLTVHLHPRDGQYASITTLPDSQTVTPQSARGPLVVRDLLP